MRWRRISLEIEKKEEEEGEREKGREGMREIGRNQREKKQE